MADQFSKLSMLLFLLVCFGNKPVCADMIGGSGIFDPMQITDVDNEVFSTITITDVGIIQDLSVTIEGIEHTNVGDLIAELRFLGTGGPSGPGGEPAYLFFRPNVDDIDILGSRGNLNGNYTFTTDPDDESFWNESAIPDDETVNPSLLYFASDTNGDYHDLGGPDFFQGFNAQGQWQLVITDDNDFGVNEGSVQGWSIEFHVTAPVPEPGSALLLALASIALVSRRRR